MATVANSESFNAAIASYMKKNAASSDGRYLNGGNGEYNIRDFRPNITITCTIVEPTEEAGTLSGAGEYQLGDIVTLTATPNEGYEFVKWADANNDSLSTSARWSFEAERNMDIYAIFRATA